jgi:2'-5' RNA ligase
MDGRDRRETREADAPERPARLFVAVWPTREVARILEAMERPHVRGVRWTAPPQWHVTLAFLGDVAEPGIAPLGAALVGVAARAAALPEARLGPATVCYGRNVLGVPVAGLDELAEAVRGGVGPGLSPVGTASAPPADPAAGGAPTQRAGTAAPSPEHPFRGHLTLARGKGGRPVPASLTGQPLEALWRVREVCLVRSEMVAEGARYTTLVRATVGS